MSTIELAHLPADVQGEVYQFLPTASKLSLSMTCSGLLETSTLDSLWQTRRFKFWLNGPESFESLREYALLGDAYRAHLTWRHSSRRASELLECTCKACTRSEETHEQRRTTVEMYYSLQLEEGRDFESLIDPSIMLECTDGVLDALYDVAEGELYNILVKVQTLAARMTKGGESIEVDTAHFFLLDELMSVRTPYVPAHWLDVYVETYETVTSGELHVVRALCRRAGILRITARGLTCCWCILAAKLREDTRRIAIAAQQVDPDDDEASDSDESDDSEAGDSDDDLDEDWLLEFAPRDENGFRTFSPSMRRVKEFFKGRLYC
ncbi:hypothetical protein TeGR_g12872 [Tetraparma gracilis]|uniref:F-box domain-containing protein n=1 Tax=Tetraparma gracilis TaxID=2962635 RepID=A0ABQ6M421_9STRA|nr:hypothetical protein TeGR_g12872 [Tetraparma gracilis]